MKLWNYLKVLKIKMNSSIEKTYIIDDKIFVEGIAQLSIQNSVKKLSDMVRRDYRGKKIDYLIILKGAIFVATDIIRMVGIESEIHFLKASSYGEFTISSGAPILSQIDFDPANKDIIIIEDIIETGITLFEIISQLEHHKPNSIEILTLLSKPGKLQRNIKPKYIGMEIPDEFAIGFGLDYKGKGRFLDGIYFLKSEK